MESNLNVLLEAARHYVMSPREMEEQRRSFAYGNGAIDNPNITRELVDEVADRMERERKELQIK